MVSYIISGLGFISMCCFLFKRDNKSSVIAISLKTLTSVLFIVCGIASLIENITSTGNTDLSHVLPIGLFVLGLVFGMVGDILLDFKIYFKTLNMRFLCLEYERDFMMITGMTAFAIGHILYITALILMNPSLWLYLLISAAAGAFIIAFVMVLSVKVMKMDFRKFFVPCIIYGFLLATFVVFTAFILAKGGFTAGHLIMLIGSVMFIISDLILSITYFSKATDYEKKGILNPESRFMIILNHTAYYAAQYLIAIAILFL